MCPFWEFEMEILVNNILLLTPFSQVTRCPALRKLLNLAKPQRTHKVNIATVGHLAHGEWRLHVNSLPSLSKPLKSSLL